MTRVSAGFAACTLALLMLFGHADAEATQPLRAGVDHVEIEQQPVGVISGVEVIDFFWYGCPHCNNLQPGLERWISRKSSDVTVRRIPAILRETWAPHARIYYTLEALGEVQRLHQRVYDSYHIEKLAMSRPEIMSDWAVRQGIPRERWDEAYSSTAVERKLEEAARLTRAYRVTGTPSLVVQGRYLTSGNMAESLDGLINTLDRLVTRERNRQDSR